MDDSRRRDLAIGLVLLTVTWVLYTVSILDEPATMPIHEWNSSDPWEPVPFRMNFIFDSDGPRVIHALIGDEGYYGHKYSWRHPLFVLFLAPVMAALLGIGLSPILSALIIMSFFGAATVAMAYLCLRKYGVGRPASLAWTTLLAVSAPIWIISSVADSFPINALCVVTAFYLADPRLAQPRRYPWLFARYLLFAIFAIGMTLGNAIYVGGAWFAGWMAERKWSMERLVAPVILVLCTALSIIILARVQKELYPFTTPIGLSKSHWRRAEIHWNPAPEALPSVLQTLGPDALIIRRPEVGLVPSPFWEGAGQMLVFGERGALYWCSLLALTVVAGWAGLIRIRGAGSERSFPRHLRLLAVGFIVYNILFAVAYRGFHGVPVLFASHVVFPIILLFASLVAAAENRRSFMTVLVAATLLIAGTNALSVLETRRLANRPCAEWKSDDAFLVHWWPECKTWE